MKNQKTIAFLAIAPGVCILCFLAGFKTGQASPGYYIEHEQQIAVNEPGPHDGGGSTTAFPFFGKVKDAKVTFRKRVLQAGSAIGYHLQEKQEIYYIINGKGDLTMNGKVIPVVGGDAILTMPGSSHGLKPAGGEDMAVLIVYENQ